jgi:FG-GAP-like repeat
MRNARIFLLRKEASQARIWQAVAESLEGRRLLSGVLFEPGFRIGSLDYPDSIVVADFNNDGKQDLAFGNIASSVVSVFLSNGDGTFQPQINTQATGGLGDLVAADVNGDANEDLLAFNPITATVSVLLGNGDGTFQPEQTVYTDISGASTFTAGNLNGDGKADLVIVDGLDNYMQILLNNGDGTFKPPVRYPDGGDVTAVAIGNFNGQPDIVVSNGIQDKVTVLLGNGNGTFQAGITFATDGAADALAIGDLNGDVRQQHPTGGACNARE